MNKTININLGGVFFHIDEQAYQKLHKYLDAIRKSLSDDPKGKDEILTDIEIRIGEILAEKITDVRQVVNEQDINNIIEVMGRPEEYAGDEDIFNENSSYKTKKKNKKLYRDTKDKFLGGVSSGLSHYFGMDVIWIRLAWLILLIVGFSVILYPILWILLPEANTTSEKLEMEGEQVTISNIERKIRTELTNASNMVKDGIEDVTEHVKNAKYQSKVRTGLQEIIDLFGRVFTAIFKVTGKFIGVLLLIISAATLLAILIGGFSLGSVEFLGIGDDIAQYPPFFYNSQMPIWLLTIFAFFAIGIPFILLFLLGLRIISSKVSSFSRTTNLSLLGIWLLSIMSLAFAGIEYAALDASHFNKIEKMNLSITLQDTLQINMKAHDNFELRRYYNNQTVFINDIEQFYGTNVRLDIRESNTGKSYVKISKEAFGSSRRKAKLHANKMNYTLDTIQNNLLLDAYFISNRELKFGKYSRHINSRQSMKLVVYIPKGQIIYLDKSTKNFLKSVDNLQDVYDKEMIKHYYKMTDNGLDCLSCDDKLSNP